MNTHRLTALTWGRNGALLGLVALAASLAAAAPASAATLWDQYDNPGPSGTNSQNYPSGSDQFDDFAADDVVVPDNEKWRVKAVAVDGRWVGGPGPATSITVDFWTSSGGLPDWTPYSATLALPGFSSGDLYLDLPDPAKLRAGKKYWLSVQVTVGALSSTQWEWQNRTVQTGKGAAWINPGDGWGTGCTTWSLRAADCGIDPTNPDQVFELKGKAVPIL